MTRHETTAAKLATIAAAAPLAWYAFGNAHIARTCAERGSLETFICFMRNAAEAATLYRLPMTAAEAMRIFCDLCEVDPIKVQGRMECTFEQAAATL